MDIMKSEDPGFCIVSLLRPCPHWSNVAIISLPCSEQIARYSLITPSPYSHVNACKLGSHPWHHVQNLVHFWAYLLVVDALGIAESFCHAKSTGHVIVESQYRCVHKVSGDLHVPLKLSMRSPRQYPFMLQRTPEEVSINTRTHLKTESVIWVLSSWLWIVAFNLPLSPLSLRLRSRSKNTTHGTCKLQIIYSLVVIWVRHFTWAVAGVQVLTLDALSTVRL